MKKKKLIKKYNNLVDKYDCLANEMNEILQYQESLELSLAQLKIEKEKANYSFAKVKEQFDNLYERTRKITDERDMYRKNYGELVSIAINANESSNSAISIKSIDFSDDVTTITWSDEATTSVKRMKGEKHDTHTAVAYAIAKRVLGTTSISDVVEYYQGDHSKDAKYLRIYSYLNSSNPVKRAKAQKTWEKLPESKRQSIKAIAKRV